MTKQGPGETCILSTGPIDDRGEVVDILAEVLDMTAPAARLTMAAGVELGDGDACGCEVRPDVAVQSAMRGVSMNHDQGQSRLPLRPVVLDVKVKASTVQGDFVVWIRLRCHFAGIPWTLP